MECHDASLIYVSKTLEQQLGPRLHRQLTLTTGSSLRYDEAKTFPVDVSPFECNFSAGYITAEPIRQRR